MVLSIEYMGLHKLAGTGLQKEIIKLQCQCAGIE